MGVCRLRRRPRAAMPLFSVYFVPYHKHAPIGSDGIFWRTYGPTAWVTVHTHSQNPQYLRRPHRHHAQQERGQGRNPHLPRNQGISGARMAGMPGPRTRPSCYLANWAYRCGSSGCGPTTCNGRPSLRHVVRHTHRSWRGRPHRHLIGAVHSGPPMQDDRPIGAILAGLPTISPPIPANPSGVHSAEMFVADTWAYETVPNVSETGRGTFQIGQQESPIAVGLRDHSMRTPIQFQQNFPRETAISEAAALAGKDALQFRIDHVSELRFKAILERLRDESGWDTRPSPSAAATRAASKVTRGRGISIMFRDNGYWACAAHIAVTPASGQVAIERMTLVLRSGYRRQPAAVAQAGRSRLPDGRVTRRCTRKSPSTRAASPAPIGRTTRS